MEEKPVLSAVIRARCTEADKRRVSVLREKWTDDRNVWVTESDVVLAGVRALLDREGVNDPGERRARAENDG